MANLGDQLKAFAEKTKADMETVVRKTAFSLGESMVVMSPVRSGRFRGNWQYGADTINTSTGGADDKSGRTSLNRIQAGVRGWVPGQTMYLTNSLPYAQRLESGWSGQAPAGMVKVTIANFQSHFAQALGEVR
ncbi:MAG: HK97 gp10 family phage protein [Desulfurellales bacterium]|nr:MAG: HK97 gp10 family phage protein [Desulfurellales bacterium]